MPLGTFDRSPPPFFRQGLPALSKLLLCTALAIFLMAADHRFALTQPLRNAMATALLPVERVLSLPLQAWAGMGEYFGGVHQAYARADALQQKLVVQSEQSASAGRLAHENAELRALLGLRPGLQVRSLAAEVLYEAPDPYSHKLFIDRGSRHGVVDGSPVINEAGVLGQVTRTYLMSAEVTLLIDKDAAIPVLNTRTQHRSAAFGSGEENQMELRFVSATDDVQVGDLLTTSGVDGIYPAGLPVAKVTRMDRRGDAGFARIGLQPMAPLGGVHHVLVLEPLEQQQPAHEAPATPAAAPARAAAASASRASASAPHPAASRPAASASGSKPKGERR
ncbi:MAG TPA: rod shape-determining protein MreC [Ideonella sp.]|uniref:rod shape-determining protein MreC n=1 Tax=Ideonella sp. TaxID=1929293 RepID=UPI002B9B4395|nr:rod shape-determining protein MreC [Ideonella sp.]HSI51918.1 rod shape-determining protein MreC [Ideonella sp.]